MKWDRPTHPALALGLSAIGVAFGLGVAGIGETVAQPPPASQIITKLVREHDVEGLIALLRDRDSELQELAAEALGEIASDVDDDRIRETIVAALKAGLGSSEERTRVSAAVGLIKSDPSGVRRLRWTGARALMDWLDAGDRDLRIGAALGWAQEALPHGDRHQAKVVQAVRLLVEALGERDVEVRRRAANGLKRADLNASGTPGALDEVFLALAEALGDKDAEVRSSVARALQFADYESGSKQVVASLFFYF